MPNHICKQVRKFLPSISEKRAFSAKACLTAQFYCRCIKQGIPWLDDGHDNERDISPLTDSFVVTNSMEIAPNCFRVLVRVCVCVCVCVYVFERYLKKKSIQEQEIGIHCGI